MGILVFVIPILALAQSDGSVRPDSATGESPENAVATSSIAAPVVTPATTTGTPRSATTTRPAPIAPVATPTPVTPTSSTATTTSESLPSADGADVTLLFVVAGLGALGILGAFFLLRGNQKREEEGERTCDSIKELLEEKKRELEASIREWPEEKLKQLATQALLDEGKRNPALAPLVAAGEKAQERIEKLRETIALLETRFDLCMLSVSAPGAAEYEGTLIENSLVDPIVLEHVRVIRAYAQGAWSVKDVAVSERQIEKLGEHLSDGPWHMRFRKKDTNAGIIVFRGHRFPISYADRSTWQEAIAYGRALGIPEELLDFERAL